MSKELPPKEKTNGQQAYEKMLSITNHKEMPIKITMRYNLTPIRMASIKEQKVSSVGKGVEKWEPCALFVGI